MGTAWLSKEGSIKTYISESIDVICKRLVQNRATSNGEAGNAWSSDGRGDEEQGKGKQ